MENLVKIENNEVVVSSREVAEHFGKEHRNVLANIRDILTAENSAVLTAMFHKSIYTNSQNKKQPEFLINRDGFTLLVMGFTGKEALKWKIKYIDAFNKMEEQLKNTRSQINKDEMVLRLKEVNAKQAELWLRLGELTTIPEYKQITQSYAANTLAGKEVFNLPEVNKKTYSATDIGNLLGVSANKIVRLAKQYDMKTTEYGKLFYDKAKHSNKEIETFRYYDNAIQKFKSLLAV